MKALRFEVVNAAAAREASCALEKLAGGPVAVRMTNVELIHGARDHRSFGREESVVGVQLPITGKVEGGALLCFPRRAAKALGERLAKSAVRAGQRAMADSALKEVGNIICGRYLSVLANELKAKVIPGLPRLSRGRFGPLSERAINGLSRELGSAWFLQVEVLLSDTTTMGDLLIFLKTEELPGV